MSGRYAVYAAVLLPDVIAACRDGEEVALLAKQLENQERVRAWHGTYNAALSGLLGQERTPDFAMMQAAQVADETHGPLDANRQAHGELAALRAAAQRAFLCLEGINSNCQAQLRAALEGRPFDGD